MIDYRYDEKNILENVVAEYINSTYKQHYAKGDIESMEVSIDSGHGMSACLFNIQKYAKRYGHKQAANHLDLLKIIHYATIALYIQYNHSDKDFMLQYLKLMKQQTEAKAEKVNGLQQTSRSSSTSQ